MNLAADLLQLWHIVRALVFPPWEAWLVIVVLFWFSWRGWKEICRAHAGLSEEEQLLANCEAALIEVQSRRKSLTANDLNKLLECSPSNSTVKKCLDAVWSMRLIPNPDLEAISTMIVQQETNRLATARFVPNSLLLTGLIGTLIGLTGAISKLGLQMPASLQIGDPSVLIKSLSQTLQHMQSAFSCTFWGIAGAVVVSHFLGKASSRQSRFVADLQHFYLQKLGPLVIPKAVAAQLSDVKEVLDRGEKFMASVSTIMQEAAGEFRSVLEGSNHAIASSTQQLQVMTSGIQDSLVKVSGNILDGANALKRSTDDLQRCHQDLQSAYSAMESFFNASRNQLEEQAQAQLDKMGELQLDFSRASQEIVARIYGSSDNLAGATRAFVGAGDDFRSAADRVVSKLDTEFELLQASIERIMKDHVSEMGQVDNTLKFISEEMSELAQKLDPRMLPRSELIAAKDALQACAELFSRESERVADGVSLQNSQFPVVLDVVTDIRALLRDHNEQSMSLGTHLQGFTQSMHDSIGTLDESSPVQYQPNQEKDGASTDQHTPDGQTDNVSDGGQGEVNEVSNDSDGLYRSSRLSDWFRWPRKQ